MRAGCSGCQTAAQSCMVMHMAAVLRTRTTINLTTELYREAKLLAATSGRTLTEVFEDALRESFGRRAQPRVANPFAIITFRGTGPAPDIDTHDISALLEWAEAEEDCADT